MHNNTAVPINKNQNENKKDVFPRNTTETISWINPQNIKVSINAIVEGAKRLIGFKIFFLNSIQKLDSSGAKMMKSF